MEENQIKRECKNCKFYVEHYIIRKSKLSAIGGYCTNEELRPRRSKDRSRLFDNCGYWQSDGEVKAKRYESIEKSIEKMRVHLEQIVQILKSDEKV